MGATYSDGQGVMNTANGSTIVFRYGNGTTGFDPDSGLLWFRDEWTFIEGTGLFAGATGSGVEGGSFASFDAFLAGAPVPMWMQGTITYDPSLQTVAPSRNGDTFRLPGLDGNGKCHRFSLRAPGGG